MIIGARSKKNFAAGINVNHRESNLLTKRHRSIYHGYAQIAEIDATDETAPYVTKTYRWDVSEPVATLALALWTRESSVRETLNYAHDLRKNVVSLFDGKGLRRASFQYDPYGNITSMEGDMAEENPFRFSSEHHDEDLGLVYYNYRHYNPTDGRWASRDPIAEQGGWNLYGFVGNNTIGFFDDLGNKPRRSKPNKADQRLKDWEKTKKLLQPYWDDIQPYVEMVEEWLFIRGLIINVTDAYNIGICSCKKMKVVVRKKQTLTIDADGAPNAYNPTNTGIDYNANGGIGGENYGIAMNPETRKPYIQGPNDPFPGYYVSQTALFDDSKKLGDPARYLDSRIYSYIVRNTNDKNQGVNLGDYATICRQMPDGTTRMAHAIVADTNGGSEGEGSMALAGQFTVRTKPKGGGIDKKEMTFMIYPGSRTSPFWRNISPRDIQRRGELLYARKLWDDGNYLKATGIIIYNIIIDSVSCY